MEKLTQPVVGATCPALTDENYEYHLSGDSAKFCRCTINDEPCVGMVVRDDEDQSSRFFSRGRCWIDMKAIKKCPLYGVSKETFHSIIRDRAERELDEKLKTVKDSK